jgi:hypothetical protein
MAENDHVLQCPVCQGHGELKRSEILKLLSDPDFKNTWMSISPNCVILRRIAKKIPLTW